MGPKRVGGIAFAAAVVGMAALTAQQQAGISTISVREGTSMAIALSPDRRQVAIDLQGGLWVVPIEGGVAKRITDEYGDARQPSWSPDGQTIAFQGYRDGMWRIWLVGADGTNEHAVTSGPFDDREPVWSPDGRTIAFSSDRSGNYDVWTLDVASGAVTQVTKDEANDYWPSWSPDGKALAFVSTRTPSPGVYTTTLGGQERLVAASTGTVGAPTFSPAGKVLYSVVDGERATLFLDGTQVAAGEDYFPFHAQWLSADEFLYPADGRIKRRSLSTGTQADVPFVASFTLQTPRYTRKKREYDSTAPNPVKGIVRPVLSPDGGTLAFAALGDLWTLRVGERAAAPVKLTDDAFVDSDAAWSPDGTKLAFSSDRAGGMDIWIRDLKSGVDRRLTSLPNADMAAAWSPDGRWLAFISNSAYEQGELYVVAADGGEPRKLNDRVFGSGYPSWSADGKFIVTSAIKAYSSRYREGMNYYVVVPLDGGTAEMVIPEEHVPMGKRASDGPALSPDGKWLAFVSNAILHVLPVGPDGRPTGKSRALTTELADSISWAGSSELLYIATDRVKAVSIADGKTRDLPIPLTWTRKVPTGRTVVHAGRFISGVSPDAQTDVDIVIENHRIASIQPHAAALHGSGRVVDASGLSVIPGLIESHGHQLKEHGDTFGRVHLAYGVTAFRNVGAVPYEAVEEKEAIEAGRRVGPRVYTSGYLLDGARPYYPMASTAPTAEVVDMELERARRLDYDMFKTYVRLPDTLQKRAIEGAHRIGIPTSSHEIYPSALSGTDSVEHTGATSRRGYSTKQSGLGRAYEDVIQIVSKSGMSLTPTLGLGGFQAAATANPAVMTDPRMTRLQPAWVAEAVAARRVTPAGRPESWNTVLNLHKAGALLIAGVDSPLTPFAVALHYELQDYVKAGLTPFEALRTATINPAKVMGAAADLGTLEVGKLADLVVVEGNPLADITATLNVRTVIKNGEVFTMEQLLDVPRPASTAAKQAAAPYEHAD